MVSQDFVEKCASLHVVFEDGQLLLKQCQWDQKLVALAWEDLHDKLSGTIVFSTKLRLLKDLLLNESDDLEHLIYVRAT